MLKDIVKEIFDLSHDKGVDVGVATVMYCKEHTDVDAIKTEKFINKHYNKLCDARANGTWDADFPEEPVEETEETDKVTE